jgi:uncharacterized protein (DUF58 family)
MKRPSQRHWPKHLLRIATLIVPSAIAWVVALETRQQSDLTEVVQYTLGPLWLLLAAGLTLRTALAVRDRKKPGAASVLARIDVLTASGAALGWVSAFGIVGAVTLGWASLAAVGLLGAALFHVVVLLTFVATGGSDPMRTSGIERRFVPEVATEGDELVEQIRFASPRIPIGFRMFVTGRIGPRWATTRHVLEAAEAGGEILLESDVGPALRGEYQAPPLEVWLQDTFGICKSFRAPAAGASLTVLPRMAVGSELPPLLDLGAGPQEPRPAALLATEGQFRLREYQQGDDVRRIHWVRSLAARELIVRLPDEAPPDRPHVRLVLDTYFPEALGLSCDAPAEMLDSIVRVWLAVGRALVESGARVTMVAAIPGANGEAKALRQELTARSSAAALRLGAQVAWQRSQIVGQVLTDEPTFVVSRSVLADPAQHPKARWIVALPVGVTEPPWPLTAAARLPFPMGSSDNRWSQRRTEAARIALARRDHSHALRMRRNDVAPPPPGSFLAIPCTDGKIRLEALR